MLASLGLREPALGIVEQDRRRRLRSRSDSRPIDRRFMAMKKPAQLIEIDRLDLVFKPRECSAGQFVGVRCKVQLSRGFEAEARDAHAEHWQVRGAQQWSAMALFEVEQPELFTAPNRIAPVR